MSLAEVMPYHDESTRTPDRTPPQDMNAEQCVLGSMLQSKDAIADVVEVLRGVDFYRPAHEQVYEAILDLYGRGEPADAVTVADLLGKRGELMRLGGAPYLHTLLASVPIAANAGWYAEIVREKAILRRLVDASIRIGQMSYAGEGDVDEIVDRAQAEVYSVTERRAAEDYKPLSELMQPTLDEMEAISSRGGGLSGVPTGFADLDDLTNGLHPGQMVIVAARPGMGKALALDTPLPTPTGWTTMGEVIVGEELIASDGRPTRVVAATPAMDDRLCYAITFSDGTTVVADGGHEWRASSRASRRAAAERGTPRYDLDTQLIAHVQSLAADAAPEADTYVTMAELVSETGAEFRHVLHSVGREVGPAVRVLAATAAGPAQHQVVYPRAEMLSCLAGRVVRPINAEKATEHHEVVTTETMARAVRVAGGRANWAVAVAAPIQAEDADLPLDPYALGIRLGDGHSATGLGVLNDKHIPISYLRGSERQRRDLLAGLLDTDGTVTDGGQVQYTTTSARLATGVRELVASLGYRASVASKPVQGRSPQSSTAFTINFSSAVDVFGLARKNRRHQDLRSAAQSRCCLRSVVAVEPVPSVPVRCVQVDSMDHTYLATRSMIPTHNSTMALDLARSASIKHGLTSCIFSLEMSQIEITMRLLSAEASIPLNHIRNGRMSDDDWQRVAVKMGQVSEAPLYIDDSPNLTMMEIRAKARRLRQRHDLRLVVIDYIQLMTSGKKVESRQLEVSEFSRQLKLLAKELEVPVVALSQLNRGPEQRTDKRPMLSDLRESGSLEQDADLVILLNRPDIHDKESERAGEADIDVAKHRNGPTKTLTVAFQGHYSRFIDMQQ